MKPDWVVIAFIAMVAGTTILGVAESWRAAECEQGAP